MSSTMISCSSSISAAIFELTRAIRQNVVMQRVVGYSPANGPAGPSSLADVPGVKKLMSPTGRHVVVPKNAIIDRVEFAGFNNFSAGRVEIGLGTFNNPINFPLITNATSEIANEAIGGIRDFKFDELTGNNDHAIVAQDSYVNVCTSCPIVGGLQVIVYFHVRPEVPAL